jgi:hypothetical protein
MSGVCYLCKNVLGQSSQGGVLLYGYTSGVSEFHRQTFRADSMIKNRHKTLNTYGVKMLSLRDNRQKT